MGGQVLLLDFIWCFKVFLSNSSVLQSCIKCSDDWAPSSQGHIGLSINLKLWRYDFVLPWPETIAVNSCVIGIFNFSLCSTVGMNDLHSVPLLVLSHCLCHFAIHSFFSSVAIVVIGVCCILYLVHRHPRLLLWLICQRSSRGWRWTKYGIQQDTDNTLYYYYYYLAGCLTFLHLPAPIWQLSYLFLPFVSVIPLFFY